MTKKKNPKDLVYRPKSVFPKEVPTLEYISCFGECGQSKLKSEFYKSHDVSNGVGVIPICKKCIKRAVALPDGTYDLDKLKSILKNTNVNKPFLLHVWESALASSKVDKVGNYFSNLGFNSMAHLKWENSDVDCLNSKSNGNFIATTNQVQYESEEIEGGTFVIKKWMYDLFGDGFQPEEYRAMEKKYNFLQENYTESTNMHTEALVTYVKYKVKEDMAISAGNMGEAKTWSDLASKAATNAKINPSQMSKADLMGGINTISEISQAVEEAVDIIPILPRFKYRPNDAVDFVIWCYINYIRDLQGKPLCEYSDVYNFYDERKRVYVEQYGDPYGIFTDDTTEKNRPNIEKFIKLPKDFNEISGEE
ncbi:MAG: hypothetical protein WCO84_01600 [bacterium]